MKNLQGMSLKLCSTGHVISGYLERGGGTKIDRDRESTTNI